MSDNDDGRQTNSADRSESDRQRHSSDERRSSMRNSIGDMLDMEVGDLSESIPFDVEQEPYDQWTDFDRNVGFDILWDETEQYPPTIDDDVVRALIDDTDHVYQITFDDGTVRETKVLAMGLMAYLDDDAEVVVDA